MTARSRRAQAAHSVSLMTPTEAEKARFEEDAERILVTVLHRRNWIAQDRDALANAIEGVVQRERRMGGK